MDEIQISDADKDRLDELDARHEAAKQTMEDFYEHHMDVMQEIQDEANSIQLAAIKENGLDTTVDYKIDRDTGIMSVYTLEEQQEDGVRGYNRTPPESLDWDEINKYIKNGSKDDLN